MSAAATTTVRVSREAKEILTALAQEKRCSQQQFIEALLHYATSISCRPGSWEACKPFAFEDYRPGSDTSFADKWFSPGHPTAAVIDRILGRSW